MFDTMADVLVSLDVPPERIRMKPYPGTATIRDVLRIEANEGVLCELVDGTLVEKTMGLTESEIATVIIQLIRNFLDEHDLGRTAGADGAIQLLRRRIRIPDVSFFGWHHFPNRSRAGKGIPRIYPDLAVEVISPKNTKKEMARKLREYFKAGTKLVWFVYPKTKTVDVYTSPTDVKTLTVKDTLTGGDVLPGFKAKVAKVFA
jgi:Uma2 family endonuclease